MKKVLALAVTGACTLGVAGVAQADISDSRFELTKFSVRSNDAGTAKKPKPVTLSLGARGYTASGTGQPSTSTKLRITLPRGIKWNGAAWARGKRCSVSRANVAKSDSVCPRGSRIGSGHVDATARGVKEPIDVRAYVTTGGHLGLFLAANVPLPINQMLEGKVRRGVINVAIPLSIQEPLTGVPSAIETLSFAISGRTKANGRTRGAIESTGCFNRKWVLKFENIVTDGKLTDTRRASCRK